MRPPKILIETKVVEEGVVWKIKKALCGLRTSPIAWETERDNTLRSLKWKHTTEKNWSGAHHTLKSAKTDPEFFPAFWIVTSNILADDHEESACR